MNYSPLIVALQVAVPATLITGITGILAAKIVSGCKKGKVIWDSLLSLPLVLPPTVVGFFLLMLFGKNSTIGSFLFEHGISIVFDIKGAIISAAVVSFPLMYQTARGAFEQVDGNYISAARTLGMAESSIFTRIILPLAGPGILSGLILSFARAMGEFGATIMVAGNIPGRTQTISVAIYTAVQSGDRKEAYMWTGIMLLISFISILLMKILDVVWKKGGLNNVSKG